MSSESSGARSPHRKMPNINPKVFYGEMAKIDPSLPCEIKKFTARLKRELGVRIVFIRALNLKWTPPEGPELNLGYIRKNGNVCIEAYSKSDCAAGHLRAYLKELAKKFRGDIKEKKGDGVLYLHVDKKPPRIKNLQPHFSAWFDAIKRLQARF